MRTVKAITLCVGGDEQITTSRIEFPDLIVLNYVDAATDYF